MANTAGPQSRTANAQQPESGYTELEQAHDELTQVALLLSKGAEPVVDLRPAADEVEQALGRLYEAFDNTSEPIQAIGEARAHVGAARGLLEPGAEASAAITWTLEALQNADQFLELGVDRLARLPPAAPVPARPMRASGSLPRLHHIERPRLTPHIGVPEPPPTQVSEPPPDSSPEPSTFEEMEDAMAKLRARAEARRQAAKKQAPEADAEPAPPDVPDGFSPDPLPALSGAEFTARRTRECFEEVAMAGVLRTPTVGDLWRSSIVFERRMFRNVDAIVAMGAPALSAVEALVMDTPIRDASRVWGATVVLGCVTGRDALAAAHRVFAAIQPTEPDAPAVFATALGFVPNPFVPSVLRRMLASPSSVHRAIAIEALVHRRLATHEDIAQAAADAPEVARIGLPLLALGRDPSARALVELALEDDDPAFGEAIWLAMAYSSHPRLKAVLYAALDGEQAATAARLLAIAGSTQDAGELLSRALATQTPELVDAVGWAGSSDAIPPLIDLLGSDKLAPVVAEALERITGARLMEETLVPPEDLEAPDVPEPETGEPPTPPLTQLAGDPRDPPDNGSPDKVQRPSTDRRRWRAWWDGARDRFAAGSRYRRGSPYSALVSWNELDRGPCSPDERRWLQRELILRSGGYVPFDPLDLVAEQVLALAAWEPQARAASVAPGTWSMPGRVRGYEPL